MDGYCDRCGAIAKTKFVLPSGLDLVFCGHHSREYAAGLENFDEQLLLSSDPELIGV